MAGQVRHLGGAVNRRVRKNEPIDAYIARSGHSLRGRVPGL